MTDNRNKEFIRRHIGPSSDEQKKMLTYLGCNTLDEFIKKIVPELKREIPNFKFCIIGDIDKIRKSLLPNSSNVEILGSKKNLKTYVNTSFCGLANLEIATGVQGKVLTYMSNGLPVVCSKKVAKNFGAFVLVDSNCEYEFHPEIYSALRRIDKKSIFNSLFLLFS